MSIRALTISLATLFVLTFISLPPLMAGDVGGIKGVVKDEAGQALPGVNIIIKSDNVFIPKEGLGAVTDVEGAYYFYNLPPGKYTVTASMIGYTIITKENIDVIMDRTTEVNFVLKPEAAAKEEIVVEEEKPLIQKDVVSTQHVLDTQELEALPLSGRSFQSVLDIIPGITEGATDGQPHVRGGRDNELGWYIDGFTMTDPVTGTFGMNLNYNSIEKVEIITGGFDAEYGKFMSGMVNVVTKSGGDQYHGNLACYVKNDAFAPLEGTKYRTFQPEVSLEGPIIQDKLTFFASISYANSFYDWDWMKSDYHWDGYDGQAKFTYRMTQDDKFTFDFAKSRALIDLEEKWIPNDHNIRRIQDSTTYNFKYDHIFNPDNYINVRLQYFDMYFLHSPREKPGDQIPYEEALIIAPPTADVWEELYRLYGVRSSEDLDEDVIYLRGDMPFWYHRSTYMSALGLDYATRAGKDHVLKFGYDLSYVKYTDQWVWTGYDFYVYMVNDWLDGDKDPRTGNPLDDLPFPDVPYSHIYDEVMPGEEYSRFHKITTNMIEHGLYAQDSWDVFDTIKLKYGLRLDAANISFDKNVFPKWSDIPPIDPNYNPPDLNSREELYERLRRKRPDINTFDLSPRIGVSYTPNEKTKLSAHYGIFYNSINLWYVQIIDEINMYLEKYYFSDGYLINRYEPSTQKSERTIQYQLSLDRQISKDWLFSLTGTFKETENLVVLVNLEKDPNRLSKLTAENIGYAKYWGLEFILKKELSHRWSMRCGYTFSQVKGTMDWYDYAANPYTNPNRGELVPMDWDIPHSFKLNGTYELPWWGITIVGLYYFQTGYPYTKWHWDWTYITEDLVDIERVYDSEKNEKRMKAYQKFDLTISKIFRLSERYSLKSYIKAYNLFNQAQIYDVYHNNGRPRSVGFDRRIELGLDFKF